MDSSSNNLWFVNGKYFSTMQAAMDHIATTTKGSRSIDSISADRIAILQRSVTNGERGGGLIVPEDFEGGVVFDFGGFIYEFDDSLDHFFDIKGGDEVYITNGTTVIYNEASHVPFAVAVNTETVTIDAHLIDDRRVDPDDSTVSDAKLFDVQENGSLVVSNTGSSSSDDTVLTGTVSVVTDGESGGKLTINSSTIVITDILTRYRNSDGNIEDSIPSGVSIPNSVDSDARTNIQINSGNITIKDIETPTDYYNSGSLFEKAVLNIIKADDDIETIINNPHDIDSVIGPSIDTSNGDVDHELMHVLEYIDPVDPTCISDGNIGYWHCTHEDCLKYFFDEDCKNQIPNEYLEKSVDEGGVVLPMGDEYHDYSSEWSTDSTHHWHECANGCGVHESYAEHSFTDWEYSSETGTSTRYCTVCGLTEEVDHEHTLTHVDRVAHTATTSGNIEYWYCEVCGSMYSDDMGTVEVEDITDPHVPAYHAAVAHTCTEDGNIEYYKCSVCGLYFSDEECTEEITDISDPASHDGIEHYTATDATCTEEGNIEYWYCSVCGSYFTDSDFTEEVTADDVVVAATGHSYSTAWSYDDSYHWHACCNGCGTKDSYDEHDWSEWAYDENDGVMARTCSVCGKKETEGHTHSSDSWTSDSENHWHVCSSCSTIYDSAAHTFSSWSYDSDRDLDARTCSVCSYEETRDHVHGTLDHTEAVAETCTADGNKEYWYCPICERYYLDEDCTTETTLEDTVIEATGHTLEHTEAVDATCTEDGNTEYWYCSLCGKYFSDEECTTETTLADTVIEAMGHTIEYEYDDDQHRATCSVCGEVLVAWEAHTWDEGTTCEDGQHVIYTCTECGAIRNATLPEFETYYVGIGTIVIPTMPSSPCGDLQVTREDNVYTVKYLPHLNSNTDYDINCRYKYNGKWSDYLTKNDDTYGSFTFTATGSLDYLIDMQIFNAGGTITRQKTVNNSQDL